MRCVICGENNPGCVCSRCGMDLSLCRELYPSLGADTRRTEALWVRRNQIYLGYLRAGAAKASSAAAVAGKSPAAGTKPSTAQGAKGISAGTASSTGTSARKTDQSAVRSSLPPKKAASSGIPGPTVDMPKYPTQCAPNDPELFKYRKLSADSCEITGLEGRYAGQLVIPSRIQGLQVVSIADRAFMGRTGLKTVILPSKVRKVGRFAFYGCKYLKGVQFPNIANLEPLCFGGCSNLELAAVYSSRPSKEDGTIADNAFFENGGTLWFRAQWDSEAAHFARRKGYQLLP